MDVLGEQVHVVAQAYLRLCEGMTGAQVLLGTRIWWGLKGQVAGSLLFLIDWM